MLLRGWTRRLPLVVLVLLATISIYYLPIRLLKLSTSPTVTSQTSLDLSDEDAAVFCKQNHLKPALDRDTRKTFDLVTINTELDLLEIRLHTLSPFVDYFVIVESTHTFTGHPKPLHILNALKTPRFSPFRPKIIHHTFHPNLTHPIDPWTLERTQRNALLQVLHSLPSSSPASPRHNDILLVSDIDELPRPSALHLLRTCLPPSSNRITLSTTAHLYSFDTRHSLPQKRHWLHPQATIYTGNDTIWPEDLRTSAHKPEFKAEYRVIGDAGWHCSTCFSTIREVQEKLQGFSHQEFNQPVFLDPGQIVRRVRSGVDLAERRWEGFVKVKEGSGDMPKYLWENRERFPWLVDREAENARFLDWEGPGAGSLQEWEGEVPEKWPE